MTLAEVTVCLIILGVAVTAGVQSLGSFARGGKSWQERSAAAELANALMAQISALPFEDPMGSNTIGLDAGETSGQRSTYDDVDDYNGWDASPPQDAAGASLTEYAGFRQQVKVAFDGTLAARTGLPVSASLFKKVTVTILRNDKVLAQLETVRAKQSGYLVPAGI